MILSEDVRRTEFLNSLLSRDELTVTNNGDIEDLKRDIRQLVDSISENGEMEDVKSTITQVISGIYSTYTISDLNKFFGALEDSQFDNDTVEYEAATPTRRERFMKNVLPKLGKHALDVAKTATGVALGVVASATLKSIINKK